MAFSCILVDRIAYIHPWSRLSVSFSLTFWSSQTLTQLFPFKIINVFDFLKLSINQPFLWADSECVTHSFKKKIIPRRANSHTAKEHKHAMPILSDRWVTLLLIWLLWWALEHNSSNGQLHIREIRRLRFVILVALLCGQPSVWRRHQEWNLDFLILDEKGHVCLCLQVELVSDLFYFCSVVF